MVGVPLSRVAPKRTSNSTRAEMSGFNNFGDSNTPKGIFSQNQEILIDHPTADFVFCDK